jgi:cytoskeletal protein CcmA (bactofilin family)
MFGSSAKSTPPIPSNGAPQSFTAPAKRPANVLSEGVSIEGDVTFGSELVIDGEVLGTITTTGALIIGEHAQIQAEISAASVVVHGTVEGNVFASERCALEAGGTLRGDVEAPRLAVDEKASFQGSAKIISRNS